MADLSKFRQVKKTSHIYYEESEKTFRIYSNNTIYSFCITPELTLEHLHWGENIPTGYDLRYLSQSSRMTHFTTVEAPELQLQLGGKIIMAAESLEEVLKSWRENKVWAPKNMSDFELFQRKRIENYSWRIMNKLTQEKMRKDELKREKLLNQKSIDEKDQDQDKDYKIDERLLKYSKLMEEKLKKESENIKSQQESYADKQVRNLGRAHRRNSISVISKDIASGWLGQNELEANQIHYVPSEGNILNDNKSKKKEIFLTPEQLDSKENRPYLLNKSFNIGKGTMESPKEKPALKKRINTHTYERAIGKLGKGGICSEYSDIGSGDYRSPSFVVIDNLNGSSITPLKYESHRIFKGRIPFVSSLPYIKITDEDECSTLVVTMVDRICGLKVDLIYTTFHEYDAITRRVIFRNEDTRNICSRVLVGNKDEEYVCGSSKVLTKACSSTIDFEAEATPFYLIHLSGSWGRERYIVESEITHDIQCIESSRGLSSHQHNPFVAISFGYPSERNGEIRSFSLVYSGNFLIEAQKEEMGRIRINVGINPTGFQWILKEGEFFETPEVVMVRSKDGLGGISRIYHNLYRDKLLNRGKANVPNENFLRKNIFYNISNIKYLNKKYNNISENFYFINLLQKIKSLGINFIVLDENWFKLKEKLFSLELVCFSSPCIIPKELTDLCHLINTLDLKFGVFYDVNSIFSDSHLKISHPEWFMSNILPSDKNKDKSKDISILDLTRKDLRDYIFKCLSNLLKNINIEYMRWDISHALIKLNSNIDDSRQTELSHRYIMGVYELQNRIIEAFPYLILENSSAGGGRLDPGVLFYSSHITCSDNNDSIVRLRINYGTSVVYPICSMQSIISSIPNFITGQRTRLRTRLILAMNGTINFDLDVSTLSVKDLIACQKCIEIYHRDVAPIAFYGDMYRLWNPFKIDLAAWMYVSKDKKSACVFGCNMGRDHWSTLVPR